MSNQYTVTLRNNNSHDNNYNNNSSNDNKNDNDSSTGLAEQSHQIIMG